MDLTTALLNSLRRAAGPEVRSIELASASSIILTHISGTQLMINTTALAPHIAGDPDRLVTEASGALAVLARMAAEKQNPQMEDIRNRVVPVLRPANWLTRAKAQAGHDLVEIGLAMPFGQSLFITFAAEHDDRRVPQLDWGGLGGVEPGALLELALANQLRLVQKSLSDLSATNLHMGDGTFFLRSKNLQAASLILQPFAWKLIERFVPKPPEAVLGAVVGPDAILFGPAEPESLGMFVYADMIRAASRGLRKSFGSEDDWGSDVFVFPATSHVPQCVT